MKILKKRRLEGKTDYLKRLKLLKSEKPRLVFRKTNRYIIAQYIISEEAQDKILFGISSKSLLKYGWPKKAESGLKSLTASYLTGFLIGKKILEEKLEVPILDLGMIRIIHQSKVFAFIKGIVDSGIKITSKKETFPQEDRIEGRHLKNKIPFKEIKERIEKK
jgi:large subunit ribosomal protein L18